MEFYRRYLHSLFFSKRFYQTLAAIIILFVIAYFSQVLFVIARIVTFMFFLLVIIDYIVLYSNRDGINAKRILPERLSNGDENKIQIILSNDYSFKAGIRIVDELPIQFQKRDFMLRDIIASQEEHTLTYHLKPLERGEYIF